ncbi:MAG: hypothetical protein IJ789_00245 [Bacteroidales bacterium]|nr:hypothetical protein [Bacteroidales bacterium]
MKQNDNKTTSEFDQLWQQRLQSAAQSRCPIDGLALQHHIATAQQAPLKAKTGGRRTLWWAVAAAACLAAVLLPLRHILFGHSGIRTVEIDGQEIQFACNNDCSPEGTISMLNQIVNK